jgi:CBS domain containing-hemolysin-like protein
MVTVPADAVPADIQDAHLRTGRSRFPVTAPDGSVVGVVHVRHTLVADGATARELARPPLVLSAGTDTYAALATMRARRTHLALVRAGGRVVGLVTLEDLVEQLIGEFDDETDRPALPSP